MTDTIHTVTMKEAEMKAYEAGRKAGLREATTIIATMNNPLAEASHYWLCVQEINKSLFSQ